MITRRNVLSLTSGFLGLGLGLLARARGQTTDKDDASTYKQSTIEKRQPGYTPVKTLNGKTLPYKMKNGVKEFHLIAEEVEHEFAPGSKAICWGYNGSTPGPTIEVVEGDRIRILVTNRLPEHTTIHWHGILLPSGMDGVGGLSQPHIKPGETYAYEFTLNQHGSYMYHPHADEMVQMAVGMMAGGAKLVIPGGVPPT